MTKTVIIYASSHHGNTRKVVEAMADEVNADLYSIKEVRDIDLSRYEYLGFASGVYFNKLSQAIMDLINKTLFKPQQKVFLVYTAGFNYRNYGKKAAILLKNKGGTYLGYFKCRGYDTWGPLAKVGGIAKKHPSNQDLERARIFIKEIVNS